MGISLALLLFLVPALCVSPPDTLISTASGKQGSTAVGTTSPVEVQEFFPLPKGFQAEAVLDEQRPALAAGGKVIKIRQGPFKVAPGRQVPSIDQWIPEPTLPCKDCYLT